MTAIGDYCIDKGERCGFDVWRKDRKSAVEHWWFPDEQQALDFIDAENRKDR